MTPVKLALRLYNFLFKHIHQYFVCYLLLLANMFIEFASENKVKQKPKAGLTSRSSPMLSDCFENGTHSLVGIFK